MKNFMKKVLVLSLALIMLLMTVACGGNNDSNNENNGDETSTVDTELEIKVYALNGTTALGMADMIKKAADGTDNMNYKFELFAAADQITGAILTGECAIAALPTNAAAKLYQKSGGKIQLLAINTLGVLYLLENGGEDIKSLEELEGETIYLPGAGSNPEFITAALIESAGLTVGDDIKLDTTTYPSPDALQAAMIAGQVKYAVLPEPKVTVTKAQNAEISVALDLTKEWEKYNGENTLVQGCLVVNTQFAKDHSAEIAQFLKDYEASVEFIASGSDDAIATITAESVKILPKPQIAKNALPNCNICFIAGEDMKPLMKTFCEKLYAYNPQSVGAVPTDAFYYIAE